MFTSVCVWARLVCVCWSTRFHNFNQVWAVKMMSDVPINQMLEHFFRIWEANITHKSARGKKSLPKSCDQYVATNICTYTRGRAWEREVLQRACVSLPGFARESYYEQTFSKLPKVIQVQWKLSKQKDFYVLIYGSFNQNRPGLLSNIPGNFGHKWRRLLMTRWRWRRKWYCVILTSNIFSPTFFDDLTTSWPYKQQKTKIWLVQRFKPWRFGNVWFFLIWPDSDFSWYDLKMSDFSWFGLSTKCFECFECFECFKCWSSRSP